MSHTEAKQRKFDEMIKRWEQKKRENFGKCERAANGGLHLAYSGVQSSSGAFVCCITKSLSLYVPPCLQTFSSNNAEETGMHCCDVLLMLNGHRDLRCPEAHLMVAGEAADCHVNPSTDSGSICRKFSFSAKYFYFKHWIKGFWHILEQVKIFYKRLKYH